jgi:hypothetical protein
MVPRGRFRGLAAPRAGHSEPRLALRASARLGNSRPQLEEVFVSSFPRGPKSMPPSIRMRVPVYAVGRTVFVARSAGCRSPVPLTDDGGTLALAKLGDGTAVCVLGWRPRSATSARYQVRTMTTGIEGWLPVENLRTTPKAVPTPAAVPAAAAKPAASKRA